MLRRHSGAMNESIPSSVSTMDRINLRLPPETLRAIDERRLGRAGSVSRNTWIAEAIFEKLAKEASEAPELRRELAANA